jgi:membrane peptidoglycan carboxypeptidase
LVDVSRPLRIDSYAWLFRPSLKRAQDTRIRIMLEEDAFAHIQKRWARLGYPFDHLVPSLATAIGSSADRPGALAELVGIILADGVRLPVERFESLEFGIGTPYQTLLKLSPINQPQQVLDPAIARVMKSVMSEVVDNGTAKRVKGAYHDADGKILTVGGKTGTGDQRFDEFSHGGHLLSSRVVNRTGTFVFYIGDHFFGTITAHVSGGDAADYAFTSALSAQMLKSLAPVINPIVNGATTVAPDMSAPVMSNQPLPP